VFERAGATPKRRFGKAWKSARGRRAGQSGDGVSREAGRAYCLLGRTAGSDHTGTNKILGRERAFRPWPFRKRKQTEEIGAERNAKAERWTEAVLVSS